MTVNWIQAIWSIRRCGGILDSCQLLIFWSGCWIFASASLDLKEGQHESSLGICIWNITSTRYHFFRISYRHFRRNLVETCWISGWLRSNPHTLHTCHIANRPLGRLQTKCRVLCARTFSVAPFSTAIFDTPGRSIIHGNTLAVSFLRMS